MNILAFIPARGGSKRIPGKNLATVGGLSLVERAIRCADMLPAVVSTDDRDVVTHALLAQPASHRYVDVHARLPEHATDTAQIEDALRDYLTGDTQADAVVILQPTSPFRTAAHVREALALLATRRFDSVLSVRRLHSLHPVFHGDMSADGAFVRRQPMSAEKRPRSQDLRLAHEDGAVYAFTREHFERTGSRCGGREGYIELNWRESFEIDTPEELEIARAMAGGA